MEESREFSFATMIGQCYVTEVEICFNHDEGWNRLVRIFGPPSWRRTVIMALVCGVPLLFLAFVCVILGFWEVVAFPLMFGLFLTCMPLFSLFDEEYVYPSIISRSAIQDIVGIPPKRMSLGSFKITFMADGQVRKTAFCLDCGKSPVTNYRERLHTYQAVEAAFVEAGLMNHSDGKFTRCQVPPGCSPSKAL